MKVEKHFGTKFCQIGFIAEEDYVLTICFPPFSLYFIWDARKHLNKEIKLSIHDWSIWWNLWTDSMGWKSTTPKWRNGYFHILDFLLGKAEYSSKTVEERDVEIPMPEKNYPAHIKLNEDTWKRPRWVAKTIKRIDAKIPDGIPHEGKGENSWDCGEDCCLGMFAPANSIAQGVGIIVGSVLHDRVKYGGWKDWNYQKLNPPKD